MAGIAVGRTASLPLAYTRPSTPSPSIVARIFRIHSAFTMMITPIITVRIGAAPWSGPVKARAASVTIATGVITTGVITTTGITITGIIASIDEAWKSGGSKPIRRPVGRLICVCREETLPRFNPSS